MADFKPGDMVRLKSGGPSMTVEEVGDKETICCWFGNGDEYQRRHIANVVLSSMSDTSSARSAPGKK